MANIVIIKTMIGEELIAELVSEINTLYKDAITVSRPRIFQILANEAGVGQPSIQPWIITDPDNRAVPIYEHYIASIVPAPLQVEKAYLSTVSSIALV